ncbi:MAG: glycosyltransferase family 2 protein [Metamycoplasmataceae bacterium]
MKSFSIIIPSFNSEQYIKSCLDSLINLDYPKDKVEVLVIDDGSTDNTGQIVKEIIKSNSFIKYFKKDNRHWGSVINYVVENKLANNDYVSILDSDDQLLPNAFNILNKISKNNDMLAASFYKWNGTRKTQKISPYWFLFKKELNNKKQMNTPFCLPLTFFSKKEIFYSLKKIKEGIAYQDPDYLSQLINLSKTMAISKKTIGLYYFNRAGNSMSQKWDINRFNAEYNACQKAIKNDAQEIVAYRLNQKGFKEMMKKDSTKKFIVKRKFSFKWFPWYLRGFFILIFNISLKKYFIFDL